MLVEKVLAVLVKTFDPSLDVRRVQNLHLFLKKHLLEVAQQLEDSAQKWNNHHPFHVQWIGGFDNTSLIVLNVSLLHYIDILPPVRSTINEVLEYITPLGVLPNILLLTLIDNIIL